MKRWMEPCTTISGRSWSQGLEPFLKKVIWGEIPSTISGLKSKNGVGDILVSWDIWRRQERTGMGNLGGYMEGVGYRVRLDAYH